jgi:tripartite-type tricarboxylate transporter receptor subunit TctC
MERTTATRERACPDSTRRRLLGAAAGGLVLGATPGARGQPQFTRTISIYGALPAGGILDQQLRALSERVGKRLGQPLVVEARPGAGGTLAPSLIVNAKPDGHQLATMLVNSLRYPHYEATTWDPLRDFTFIIGLSNFTFGVVVHADSPWKTMRDLIDAAKRDPGKISGGSTGAGGTGHLLMLDIERATGARFNQVPFKGGPDAIQALMGRHIDFIADGSAWAPQVKAGQFRLLALATEEPLPAHFPGAPTLRQLGIDAVGWSPYGVVGPKGMPTDVVRAIHDAFRDAMDDPAFVASLERYQQKPWYKSPEEFRAWAEKYYVEIRPTLQQAGLARR